MTEPMAAHHTNLDTTILEDHLNNIRNKIPPSIRTACFPDSTSTLLRNTILTMGVLNGFLFLGSLFTIGVRFTGSSMVLLSLASCLHLACIGMVLGSHIAATVGSLGGVGGRVAYLLSNTSTRYGADVYAQGTLFGSTVVMAILMQFASSYYKGVSACVANLASPRAAASQNATGAASMGGLTTASDPFATCGASGPVGFVAFFSGSLFWINAAFAMVLYVKRGEIISGAAPGSSHQRAYEEIGVENDFSGDFPSSVAAGTERTIHV